MMMNAVHEKLEKHQDLGVLCLRLFVGLRLIYGVADNVLAWDHMIAFEKFLESHGFPWPLISAVVSVYAQLICGLMIVSGLFIRVAALAMIINFLIALIMVHHSDTIEGMTPALAMLFCSIFFLFNGAGKYALHKD